MQTRLLLRNKLAHELQGRAKFLKQLRAQATHLLFGSVRLSTSSLDDFLLGCRFRDVVESLSVQVGDVSRVDEYEGVFLVDAVPLTLVDAANQPLLQTELVGSQVVFQPMPRHVQWRQRLELGVLVFLAPDLLVDLHLHRLHDDGGVLRLMHHALLQHWLDLTQDGRDCFLLHI